MQNAELFPPSSTRKTQLLEGERHIYSLELTDAMKQILGYKIGLVSFEGHLTTHRFILEAEKFPEWMKHLINFTSLALGMPSHQKQYFKSQFNKEAELHKDVAGKAISFPLDLIDGFEVVKMLMIPQFTRLRFSDAGKQATNTNEFVFAPYSSKSADIKSFKDRLSLAALGGVFADFANHWLQEMRAQR